MPDYFVHESSYVDDGAEIGAGTKIWHFCHVMPGAKIGERCNIGQNVLVSSGVTLGNNVKIQNNVSLYTGVIVEDDVFLGLRWCLRMLLIHAAMSTEKMNIRPRWSAGAHPLARTRPLCAVQRWGGIVLSARAQW